MDEKPIEFPVDPDEPQTPATPVAKKKRAAKKAAKKNPTLPDPAQVEAPKMAIPDNPDRHAGTIFIHDGLFRILEVLPMDQISDSDMNIPLADLDAVFFGSTPPQTAIVGATHYPVVKPKAIVPEGTDGGVVPVRCLVSETVTFREACAVRLKVDGLLYRPIRRRAAGSMRWDWLNPEGTQEWDLRKKKAWRFDAENVKKTEVYWEEAGFEHVALDQYQQILLSRMERCKSVDEAQKQILDIYLRTRV